MINSGTTDETTLNQMLIDEHHAVEYKGQSKEEIAEGHLENREFFTQCPSPVKIVVMNLIAVQI